MPNAALLVVDDLTQEATSLQKLEMEANSLRLIRTMARPGPRPRGSWQRPRAPLSTHQQLLADKYRYKDPEFRASLDVALADGVKRISRLINQMRFLARDSIISTEAFPIAPLIEEAYQEAQKYQPGSSPPGSSARTAASPSSSPVTGPR